MPENKSPNVRSFCLSNFFGSKTESKVPTAKRGTNKAIKIVNISCRIIHIIFNQKNDRGHGNTYACRC